MPPPDDMAVTRIRYAPLISSVGSNVASVAGGDPLPVASTTGVPRSTLRAETVQLAIVSPAGGAMVAMTVDGLGDATAVGRRQAGRSAPGRSGR